MDRARNSDKNKSVFNIDFSRIIVGRARKLGESSNKVDYCYQ